MKKKYTLCMLGILAAGLLCASGCAAPAPDTTARNNAGSQAVRINSAKHNAPLEAPTGEVVEIKEKMFVAQINDIYLNPEEYLGKTLRYEGIFDTFTVEDLGETYCAVIRYGPGCCGTDSNAGFEIAWDGETPKQNDWVEVVGVLEEYEEDGWEYLQLRASSLRVLETRGAENVTQ